MRVFLSAVTKQFGECRDRLADDLRAAGAQVVVQEEFVQRGQGTLLAKLEAGVAGCERVVALVGDACGVCPTEAEAPGRPMRSYTQWEYWFGRGERIDGSFGTRKEVFVYLARPAYLAQHAVLEDAETAGRQAAFVAEILKSGKDRREFGSLDELRAAVLLDGFQLPRAKPFNLPYESIGGLFKGRDEFLARVRASLDGDSRATVVSAVHGLGGVGKTRLAVEYAWKHRDEYSAVLHVMAETPEALRRNLAALVGPAVLDLPEQAAREEDIRVEAALRWMREHPGWLLILDNVDTKPALDAVQATLPKVSGGHVLITSRRGDWAAGVETLELEVLDEDAAVAFLLERTKGRRRATPSDGADARALAQELGNLALGLEQAGALIGKLRISFAEYLRRWKERDAKVREWHDAGLMKYPRSVATTWDTSFEQLGPTAQALLGVLSWFAPEPIPRAVCETMDAHQEIAKLLARKDGGTDVEEAVAELTGLSLLKWEAGNRAFRVHRLVQEVTRARLLAGTREASLSASINLLDAYLPTDPPPQDVRSWPLWDSVRAHVAAVVAAPETSSASGRVTRLMNAFGLLLKTKGAWSAAETLYRRALAIDEREYGSDHPGVAASASNLAQLLETTNRLGEAERLMRRVVAIFEASFGADHPKGATALNNLAQLLLETNRLGEAEPLLRRALAIDEKEYGPEHPEVAIDLSNLARLLRDTNRPGEAESLMVRALAIAEESYDPEHPKVAIRLNNLAQLLHDTNRLGESEPLMRRALLIDEKSYGPDHPSVATDLSNLARLLLATNRLGEAEPLMRRALDIDEKSFGPDHPRVAIRLNNLAALLQATNRRGEAEPLLCHCLQSLLKSTVSTGRRHPHLLAGTRNYAALLTTMGRAPNEVRAQLNDVGRPFGVPLGDDLAD